MNSAILIKPLSILFIWEEREEYNSSDDETYDDVTELWLLTVNSNSHKVKDKTYFEHEGVKYIVDGKNIVLDYSFKEKEVAEWLVKIFGGEIYMMPRINEPEGIKTPDYLFRGEHWDLKSVVGNGIRVIEDSVKRKKKQAHNFIFDLTGSSMKNNELLRQLRKIYESESTNFIDKIIIKKGERVIFIYERKKR